MLLKTRGSNREVLSESSRASESGLTQVVVSLATEPVNFSEYDSSIHQPVVSYPTHARGVQDLYYGSKRAVLQARGRAVTNPTAVTSAEYKQYIHEVYTHAKQTKEQADRVVFSSGERRPTSPSVYTPISFKFPAGYVRQLPPISWDRSSSNIPNQSRTLGDTSLSNLSSTIRNELRQAKTNLKPQTTPLFARSHNKEYNFPVRFATVRDNLTGYTPLEKATTSNLLNHEPHHSRAVEDGEESSCIVLDSEDNLSLDDVNKTISSRNIPSRNPINHDSSCLQETGDSDEVICLSDSDEDPSEIIRNGSFAPNHSEIIHSEAANSEIAHDELTDNQTNCSEPFNIESVQKEAAHSEPAQPELSNSETTHNELGYSEIDNSVTIRSESTHGELVDSHSNNSGSRCESRCEENIVHNVVSTTVSNFVSNTVSDVPNQPTINEASSQCISVGEVSLSNHTSDCHEEQSDRSVRPVIDENNITPRLSRAVSDVNPFFTDSQEKPHEYTELDGNILNKPLPLLESPRHDHKKTPDRLDFEPPPIRITRSSSQGSSQGSSRLTDASIKPSVSNSIDDNTMCNDLLEHCDNHSFGKSPRLADPAEEPILSPADGTVLNRSQLIVNWLNDQNPQNFDIVASCSSLPLVYDTSANLSITDKVDCSTADDILGDQSNSGLSLIKPSLNEPDVESSEAGSVRSAVEVVNIISPGGQFKKLPSISGSDHEDSEASWYSDDEFYDCVTELDDEGNVIARPARAGKKRRRQTENYRDILNQSRELAELGPLPREVSTPYSLRRILPEPSPEKPSNRRLSAGPTHTTSLTRANATPYLLREPHELHQADGQIQDAQDVSVENLPKQRKSSRVKRSRNQ